MSDSSIWLVVIAQTVLPGALLLCSKGWTSPVSERLSQSAWGICVAYAGQVAFLELLIAASSRSSGFGGLGLAILMLMLGYVLKATSVVAGLAFAALVYGRLRKDRPSPFVAGVRLTGGGLLGAWITPTMASPEGSSLVLLCLLPAVSTALTFLLVSRLTRHQRTL